jgi:hypothetical protein
MHSAMAAWGERGLGVSGDRHVTEQGAMQVKGVSMPPVARRVSVKHMYIDIQIYTHIYIYIYIFKFI